MSDMREKLKPCPFCHGIAIIQEGGGKFYVACTGTRCFCAYGEGYDRDAMSEHVFGSEEEAMLSWNARADTGTFNNDFGERVDLATVASAIKKFAPDMAEELIKRYRQANGDALLDAMRANAGTVAPQPHNSPEIPDSSKSKQSHALADDIIRQLWLIADHAEKARDRQIAKDAIDEIDRLRVALRQSRDEKLRLIEFVRLGRDSIEDVGAMASDEDHAKMFADILQAFEEQENANCL